MQGKTLRVFGENFVLKYTVHPITMLATCLSTTASM